jgi:alkylated DNA nucleotide flippase Atl1
MCGRKLHPPFFSWHGETAILICGACVAATKSGMQLDLIHLSAIVEMHRVDRVYSHVTLERNDAREAARKEQMIETEGVAFIRKSKGQNSF